MKLLTSINHTIYFCAFYFLITSECSLLAGTSALNSHWVANQGQLKDLNGRAIDFCFFQAELGSSNVYVTSKGLTFVFLNWRDSIKSEAPNKKMHEVAPFTFKDKNLVYDWIRQDVELVDAEITRSNIVTEGKSESYSNYFLGHIKEGVSKVHSYKKVTIKNVYPKIDWVIAYVNNYIKQEFIVRPGGDPSCIKLRYVGGGTASLINSKTIQIKTSMGAITESALYCHQVGKEVASSYALKNNFTEIRDDRDPNIILSASMSCQEVSFKLGLYDSKNILVIDPQLYWSTLMGGKLSYEGTSAITSDAIGNTFITGYCSGPDFPTLSSGSFFQGTSGGGYADIFITKMNRDGVMIWSTYYGGNEVDYPASINSDLFGNIFLTGSTSSYNFPLFDAGTYYQDTLIKNPMINYGDIFILKFDNNGNRLWATYYGGDLDDYGQTITTDYSGNLYIAGQTSSAGFPVQSSGTFFQGNKADSMLVDGFMLKFDNSGNRLWATYYGGLGIDKCISSITDNFGNYFVVGETKGGSFPVQNSGSFFQGSSGGLEDAFILKFDSLGNRLWATYYGGADEEGAQSVDCDPNGNIVVTGYTRSLNLPLQNSGGFYQAANAGEEDLFILKFDNAGNRIWATYYGGSGRDESKGIGVNSTSDELDIDECGNIYIAMNSNSLSLPTRNTCDAGFADSSNNGGPVNPGPFDLVLLAFSSQDSFLWGTYIGGDGFDFRSSIEVDYQNSIYITGEWTRITDSSSYPMVNPGGGAYFKNSPGGSPSGDDVYIMKFLNDQCVCNIATGVSNLPSDYHSIKIYPQPANSYIYIEFPNEIKMTKYAIRDIFGRTLLENNSTVNSKICAIDINAFPSGIYMVEVKGERDIRYSELIAIAR